jgi:hypothetical protein
MIDTNKVKSISLDDFEKRYFNIRKHNPTIKTCSVKFCTNPRDTTEIGEDSSCAYHRILFDIWSCEVMDGDRFYYYLQNQRARRSAFTHWRNKLGKDKCDKLVLREAQSAINWVC